MNNNNLLGNKAISDNKKVTDFYALKASAPYQSPLMYFGQKSSIQPLKTTQPKETGVVKRLFAGDVALNKCSDCKDQGAPPSKVSNLVSDPTINVKYDDAWFLKHNPQVWTNMRTMGKLSDIGKPEDDPIMQLNPTLYKQVQVNRDTANYTDPFHKIMEQQNLWIENNQTHGFIKDMVYRSDIDHPNSMHNYITSQENKVHLPKTAD